MNVRVIAMGYLADLLPTEFTLALPSGATAATLLAVLANAYPAFAATALEDGRFKGGFQVVIGDRLLDLAGGWERPLADNDLLTLLPPFSGG